jgi:hypothetical protein
MPFMVVRTPGRLLRHRLRRENTRRRRRRREPVRRRADRTRRRHLARTWELGWAPPRTHVGQERRISARRVDWHAAPTIVDTRLRDHREEERRSALVLVVSDYSRFGSRGTLREPLGTNGGSRQCWRSTASQSSRELGPGGASSSPRSRRSNDDHDGRTSPSSTRRDMGSRSPQRIRRP